MTNNVTGKKQIGVFGAFALSIGTAIGWGSFVVTSSDLVSKAGPLGSIIGLTIGMLVMIVVAYNYHYMMNKYPDENGGIYSYAKHTFGSDHAFLCAWFLLITYSAILWANTSSFSLFARYIFGNTFQFGFHYSIGGYDVWLGEILLSMFFICLFGGICLLKKKITTRIQFGFALIFISVVIAGFIVAAIMHQGGVQTYKPDFAPTGDNEFVQIIRVIGMTPWAFIGFESISHSSKHFTFAHKKTFKVLLASVIITTVMYILMCQITISAFPDAYSNWVEYLNSSESLTGLDAIPAFYVINRYIGMSGVVLFALALFSIIATSLIGNIYGLTGLIDAMAEDHLFPKFMLKKDKNENSVNTIFVLVGATFFMLFFGRALIGWIVDVNNICGIIIYSYIAAMVVYQARKDKKNKAAVCGIAGLLIGLGFTISTVITSIIRVGWIAKESVLIFVVWALFGFIFYAVLLKKDKNKVFGHSMAAIFGLFVIIIYSIGSWLVLLLRENVGMDRLVGAIVTGVVLVIGTQIAFFVVFNTINRREIELQNRLVLGMATMVEGRDNSTGGHIKRTSKVVALIVEEMKKDYSLRVNHKFYENVIKAAPMHDLGKIAVDDAVLRKPGKFTPEEFDAMKKHSPEGAKIVEDILNGSGDDYFKEIAINVACYHHERWDGSGYPKGLKGEEIPLEARIMAIADVYDALVSKRVYKERFSFEEANDIILDGMGKHFDKGLEKYYLQAREKIEALYKESE